MGEPRPQAGMLFYNDEGTENGGLIFGGHMNTKGEVVDSGGSLSFDKYGDGQIVQLAGVDDKENQFAGLRIGHAGQRVWIGQDRADNASVSLTDAKGNKRIVIEVDAKGSPSISFLDSEGHVQRELAPKN